MPVMGSVRNSLCVDMGEIGDLETNDGYLCVLREEEPMAV